MLSGMAELAGFLVARTAFATLLALGLVFALLTGVWLAAYAVAAARARRLLARDRIRRALDAVTAAVLVALGLRVAPVRG
jgi:threonine/homoserine/homoserine lactone efflux protein